MARPVIINTRIGGGSPAEILFGEASLEPTSLRAQGTSTVFPSPTVVGIDNGVATFPDVEVSPQGPLPEWCYKLSVRDARTGRAWSRLVGVPEGVGLLSYNDLTVFESIPIAAGPEFVDLVSEAVAAKEAAQQSEANSESAAIDARAAAGLVGAPAGDAVRTSIAAGGAARPELESAIEKHVVPVASAISGAADPFAYVDNVKLLCEFPVQENGEKLWPQGFALNAPEDEIYTLSQNGDSTVQRIDVRSIATGVRKSSRTFTAPPSSYCESLPWWKTSGGELMFAVRTVANGQGSYTIFNYSTGEMGPQIPILGSIRMDVEGPFLLTSDAWTNTVAKFYIYDWESVMGGTPVLLATIPVEGNGNTIGKNQGLAIAGGNFFLIQGSQSESPALMGYDFTGRLRITRKYSRASLQSVVNTMTPGTLTNESFIYEAEGATNLNGRLVTAQIVNDTPSVTASGRMLILMHSSIDGVHMTPEPSTSYVRDTGWIPLTLINGFTAAYGPVPAVRRIGTEVIFRGHVMKNAATNYETAAMLPPDPSMLPNDLFPRKTETFPCSANTTHTLSTRVTDTGRLELYSSSSTGAWRSLSGIRYFLD